MIFVWREDRKKVKGKFLPRTGHEGARWGWEVNATTRPLYPPARLGGGGGARRVCTGAENLAPIGIRSPDRSARSEFLYRLSYSGP
jgi:hypothetical protein